MAQPSEIRQACVSGKILHVSGSEPDQILRSREGPYGNKVAFLGTVRTEKKKTPENKQNKKYCLFGSLIITALYGLERHTHNR